MRRAEAPAAGSDASRGVGARPGRRGGSRSGIGRPAGPLGTVILALAAMAAIGMIATEFLTIVRVEVLTASCEDLAAPRLAEDCVKTGGDQHSYALILLGALSFAMALGAASGRSRPAAAALIAVGLVVLAIAIAGDLPDTDKTGAVGADFASAKAEAGEGFYVEILAALLAIAAGVLGLMRDRLESRSSAD